MKVRKRDGRLNLNELKKLGLSGKVHDVDCPGDHSAHADNCPECMPRWAKVEIPIEHSTVQDWYDFKNQKIDLKA